MNQNVVVKICGKQMDLAPDESIETMQQGRYRYMQKKHIVSYQELLTEVQDQTEPITCSCLLKISPQTVILTKKGMTEMRFEKNRLHSSVYVTSAGSMNMGIYTTEMTVTEEEDKLTLHMEYSLEINTNHVSNNVIDIYITSL